MIEDNEVKIAETKEEAFLRTLLERTEKDTMESKISIELNEVIMGYLKDKLKK